MATTRTDSEISEIIQNLEGMKMTDYTDAAWENAKKSLMLKNKLPLLEITIQLCGPPAVGKSTEGGLLAEYLSGQGFDVLIRDESAPRTNTLYGCKNGIKSPFPMQPTQLIDIFSHPRFIGLWTYRPRGKKRQFCSSVMVDGEVQETSMYDDWEDALVEASEILEGTDVS